MSTTETVIEVLRNTLPPTFARSEADRLTGGLVKAGSLANEASKGTGPGGMFFFGRKACYEREAFLAWLSGRLAVKSKRNPAREAQAKRAGA